MATKTKAQRARSIYAIVFGLYTVFVGVLWIWQVWAIYHSAESKPFSAASISAHFQQIQWFVWIWVVGLIVNLVLGILFPEEKKKSGYVDYAAQLKKMRARLPDDGKFALKDKSYSLLRKILWGVCGAVIIAGIVVCAYYFSGAYTPNSPSEFLSESNGVAERLLNMLPFIGGVSIFLAVAAVYDNFLTAKELSLVKQAVAAQAKHGKGLREGLGEYIKVENGSVETPCPHCQKKLRLSKVNCAYQCPCCKHGFIAKAVKKKGVVNQKTRENDATVEKKKVLTVWIARGVLACAAVVLIVVGICNGGMMDVLQKAINICTQCIGLG
ncbi:MAG: hypothetical protein IJ308_06100 [Clostridia bacterium]|nr:hypothetical protein [Clostridia bacterium]